MEVVVRLDEPGKAYFVVVARGATAPTSAEVIGGADYGGRRPLARKDADFDGSGGEDRSCSVAGLTEATDYDVHVVAVDEVSDDPLAGKAFPTPTSCRPSSSRFPPRCHPAAHDATHRYELAGTSRPQDQAERGGYRLLRGGPSRRRGTLRRERQDGCVVDGRRRRGVGTVALRPRGETAGAVNQLLTPETAHWMSSPRTTRRRPLGTPVKRVNPHPGRHPADVRGPLHRGGRGGRGDRSGLNLTVQLDEPGVTHTSSPRVRREHHRRGRSKPSRRRRGHAANGGGVRRVASDGGERQFTVVVETSARRRGSPTATPFAAGVPALPPRGP